MCLFITSTVFIHCFPPPSPSPIAQYHNTMPPNLLLGAAEYFYELCIVNGDQADGGRCHGRPRFLGDGHLSSYFVYHYCQYSVTDKKSLDVDFR